MIRTQLKYEEEAIKSLLSQSHFILEACVENELPEMDLAFTINSIKGKERSEQARRVIEAMKTHKPVEVTSFHGLRKWSAEWWVAIVKLSSHIKTDLFALLVGWTNTHGTSAIVSSYSEKEKEISEIFEVRINGKVRQKYTQDCSFKNLILDVADSLPELPGALPLPADLHMPKISHVAGLEGILSSLGHSVAPSPKMGKPRPDPAPAGKPKVRTSSTSLASPSSEPPTEPKASPVETKSAPEPTRAEPKKVRAGGRLTKEEKKRRLKESIRKREEESDW